MYQVIRPRVPYEGPITGGCHIGKRIEIRGCIPYGADRFTVNLQAGLRSQADRPLHISVRFDEGLTVVRNTRTKNSYGPEERTGPFPFAIGQNFKLEICVELSLYRIFVNGQPCFNYVYRLPFSSASSITIDGDVQIHQIDFINSNPTPVPATVTHQPVIVAHPPTPIYPTPAGFQDPYNLQPQPCIFPIYGGIRSGMCIFISGRPTAAPKKLTINLQNGASTYRPPDIAFHFDARFFNYTVVRNSRVNNVWGSEETMISHFPFQSGAHFELQINIQANAYSVILNGQHFISFRHRLTDFSRFDTLNIENDAIVSCIRYN